MSSKNTQIIFAIFMVLVVLAGVGVGIYFALRGGGGGGPPPSPPSPPSPPCPKGQIYDNKCKCVTPCLSGMTRNSNCICAYPCTSPAVSIPGVDGNPICAVACNLQATAQDNYPKGYCMPEQKCGTNLVTGQKGCLLDNVIQCGNTNSYCPWSDKCVPGAGDTPYTPGEAPLPPPPPPPSPPSPSPPSPPPSPPWTCRSPTCGDPPAPAPSVSTCHVGGNDCIGDGATCSLPPTPTATPTGLDIGICNINQPLNNTNSLCCPTVKSIGEDDQKRAFCCKNGKHGVSMIGNKQCTEWLVTNDAQEKEPCCAYGLCANGWQCSPTSKPNDPACSLTTWNSFQPDDKVCCKYRYTIGSREYCCPNKIVAGGECLNTTAYKLDPNWFGGDPIVPTQCTTDAECQTHTLKSAINKALDNNVKWLDGSTTSPPTSTDSLLYCDAGLCKLGCGYRSDTSGTLTRPYRVVNVDNNTVVGIETCDPTNDNSENCGNVCLPVPGSTGSTNNGRYYNTCNSVSRCMNPGSLEITGGNPKLLNNPSSPVIACTDVNSNDNVPYWSGNDIAGGSLPNYTNKLSYSIKADPTECPNALNIGGAAVYSGSTNDGNSYTIPGNTSANGTSAQSGGANCIATIDCQHAKSQFIYNGTVEQGKPPISWWTPKADPSYQFPSGVTDINARVSMIPPLDGCGGIATGGPTGQNCYLPSPGGLTIPSSFTADQTVSPCYYDSFNNNCSKADSLVPTRSAPSPGVAHYPSNQVGATKIVCNNQPCVPKLLSDGKFCPNGTVNGIGCLP